jgi:predicted DNA binding CopG/RHH family protein
MKKKNTIKTIPAFASETAETRFWNAVDSTAYFSGKGGVHLKLPTRTTTISLRLTTRLLERLNRMAILKDVPYQSLLKIFLDEKIQEEISVLKKAT